VYPAWHPPCYRCLARESLAPALESWIAVVGSLLTAVFAIVRYFNYRSRRDRVSIVGQAFTSTIDGLGAEGEPKQLAAAILLRRFFDAETEQGAAGVPYGREAIGVIAALLRTARTGELQKLLADGLAYAPSLQGADLQGCNLSQAYLGKRLRASVPHGSARLLAASRLVLPWIRPRYEEDVRVSSVDLTEADLFDADLSGASLRGAIARRAVFYTALASGAVFEEAHLEGADFRRAKLAGARFRGAYLEGAKFNEAEDIPPEIAQLLDAQQSVPSGSGMPVVPATQ
jgi:pentapeptide repeat protein